ncbi:Protein of unknown function [Pyronema omphalodes CBS 100304]|jgi:hypothetical protein
MQKK